MRFWGFILLDMNGVLVGVYVVSMVDVVVGFIFLSIESWVMVFFRFGSVVNVFCDVVCILLLLRFVMKFCS